METEKPLPPGTETGKPASNAEGSGARPMTREEIYAARMEAARKSLERWKAEEPAREAAARAQQAKDKVAFPAFTKAIERLIKKFDARHLILHGSAAEREPFEEAVLALVEKARLEMSDAKFEKFSDYVGWHCDIPALKRPGPVKAPPIPDRTPPSRWTEPVWPVPKADLPSQAPEPGWPRHFPRGDEES